MSWPPQLDELKHGHFSIPQLLTTFLQHLIYSRVENTQRDNCRLTSIAKDLMFSVTKKPLPKHIRLPFTIKSLTGNTELIKIVNCLGHGISYSKTLEIDTSLAIQKLVEARTGVVLPNDTQYHQQTSLVYDNIDRLGDIEWCWY